MKPSGQASSRIGIALSATLVLLMLASCGSRVTQKTTLGGGRDLLVWFSQTGGFAGVDVQVEVYADGRVVRTKWRTRISESAVPPDMIDRLQRALESAQFPRLKRTYRSGIIDDFSYDITYRGKSIRTSETVMPKQLNAAVGMLSGLARPFDP